MNHTLNIRSPKYDEVSISIPPEITNLDAPFSGSVCSRKGDEYEIKNNIIDLLGSSFAAKSLTEVSNGWGVTAAVYEDYWRKNAIPLMSGETFPLEEEKKLIHQWINPQPDKLYLDIGCSTALYSRFICKMQPKAVTVAIDYSLSMLKKAREKAAKETARLYLLRADAGDMPFFRATFDGLVMGGTMNELNDPRKVFYEARRVIKEGGTFFNMHLLTAKTWYGRILQEPTKLGGIKYWSLNESNSLFRQSGFEVDKQITRGMICFSLLKAV